MTANKPRNSVLYLFDPLSAPITPRRESSPDSGSDKENDVPPGEVTMFFNRMYKAPIHSMPKTPQGCLIDFNTTMDEAWDSDIAFEGDENASSAQDFDGDGDDSLDTTLRSPSAQRRPLADIDLDATPRPRTVGAWPQANLRATVSDGAAAPPAMSQAPLTSPLAEVINSINLSAMSVSVSEPSSSLVTRTPVDVAEKADEINEMDMDTTFPLITVCPPPVSDQSTKVESAPTSPTALLSPPSSLAPPTRRPLSVDSIPADDPRRCSVDLHASFSMQIHSPEMSFDLLNDNIPFLGQDSVWVGADDDEFDMEAEMKNMEAAAAECERDENARQPVCIAPAPSSPVIDRFFVSHEREQNSRPASVPPCVEGQLQLPQPPALGQSTAVYQFMEKPCVEQESLKSVAPPFVLENTEPEASEPQAQPVPAEMPFAAFRRASVGSPVATPTSTILSVPALRIVKKTWKVHGRTDSATSTGSTESSLSSSAGSSTSSSSTSSSQASKTEVRVFSAKSSSTTKVESAKQDTENDHLLVPAPARTTIRGVQRPPVMPQVSSTAAEEAARRFAAAGIQRPNPQHPVQLAPMPHRARPDARVQVGVGFASRLAPQRSASVAPTTVRPASGSISKAGGSLLRAPTRYGSVGAAAGASALPRPASRMPAPASTTGGAGALRGRDGKTGATARGTAGVKRGFF